MLRVEESFEFRDPILRALDPHMRQYHVVEQVFEWPLWIAKVLPMQERGTNPDARIWSRYVSSSMRGLLGIVLNPNWERMRIHVVLPGYMALDRELRLARCLAIWEAAATADGARTTWIFETDHGTFADPELGLDLGTVQKRAVRWRDFEADYDDKGRIKV